MFLWTLLELSDRLCLALFLLFWWHRKNLQNKAVLREKKLPGNNQSGGRRLIDTAMPARAINNTINCSIASTCSITLPSPRLLLHFHLVLGRWHELHPSHCHSDWWGQIYFHPCCQTAYFKDNNNLGLQLLLGLRVTLQKSLAILPVMHESPFFQHHY